MHRPLLLALVVSALLLGGALLFQYVGGLAPCELCVAQRWPHAVSIALGLAGLLLLRRAAVARLLAVGCALALLWTGLIGLYHVGVEQKWWSGPSACTAGSLSAAPAEALSQIVAAPLVQCDSIAWSLFGISMAGYNALISTLAAFWTLWLTLRAAQRGIGKRIAI